MKNKILLSIALLAGALTSCDMDLAPVGQIDDKNAMQGFNDAYRFRANYYASFRGFTSSSFFTYPEIQADQFNGLVINGNNIGEIANGLILSNTSDIASFWLSCYARIANLNYFLENVQPLYDKAVADEDETNTLLYNLMIGEARFFRGYYYACMFDRWCQVYSADKGDQPALGLPIVTKYMPTDDRSTYPGRSTMNETLNFINADIQAGLDAVLAYEEAADVNIEPMDNYLSSYAIKAMQARIALWIGDYANALALSTDIIESGIYPLCDTSTASGKKISKYENMWVNDAGSEIIFLPYEDTQELGGAIGEAWIKRDVEQAWYIPTPECIAMYDEAGGNILTGKNDVRYNAFLGVRDLKAFGVSVTAPCFYKFPGNPALETTSSSPLYNKPKPFRTSEQYLIAAEASFMLGNEADANKYLNTLCKARIKKYANKELSGVELRDAIRHQRTMELIGEGFRISDLRRWKIGFSRAGSGEYEDYPEASLILTEAGLKVTYTADDHRYTWPIPADEIQSNPHMVGQQNPGY